MKKSNIYIKLLLFFLITTVANAQVAITESFEENSLPSGWLNSEFSIDATNPCDTSSARAFCDSDEVRQLTTPEASATGEDIEISFDYKIVNGPTTVPAQSIGTLEIQYTLDNGATWITPSPMSEFVIDENNGYTESTTCQTILRTLAGSVIPEGDVRFRFLYSWDDAEGANPQYYLYIDNVQIIEQVDCVQPINLNADNITYDSFDLSWEEIDGSSEWEIYYGPAGSAPSGNNVETVTSETNPPNTSITITGLSEGETYDVYIRSRCGEGAESAWSNPISVQTKAFGSVCGTPINVMTLPYTQNNIDMAIYANNYTGSPGESCGTEGDYLNGYDIVFNYVPTQDDLIEINLSNLSIPHTGIFIYSSCADIGTNCLAGEINATNTDYGIEDFFVSAEENYYIVVSTIQVQNFSFDIEIKRFDCDTFNAPNGETNQEFVAGQNLSDLFITPTTEEAILTWYDEDPELGSATMINDPSSEMLIDGETYYVTQTIGNCESPALAITVMEFDCETLSILSYEGDDIVCEEGEASVTLTADAATDNIYWFNSENGEEILEIGSSYTTPILSETTSYWVSEVYLKEGLTEGTGKPLPSVTEYQWEYVHPTGLEFEVINDFTLKSVDVYAVAEGAIDLVIINKTQGELITIIPVELPPASVDSPVPVTIEINEELQAGSTYQIYRSNGPPMLYDHALDNDLQFPYLIGDSGKITNGFIYFNGETYIPTTAYHFFYNWIIVEDKILCESDRQEVQVPVYEGIPVDIEASADVVCIGDSVDLTATSTYENYEYTWTPGTMLTGNSITVNPTQNTTYTLTATDTETGCETIETIDVAVKGFPNSFNIKPENPAVCIDKVLRLTAGSIAYTFEAPSEWVSQDNSTPINMGAEWQIYASGHEIENERINSKDNSLFYLSDGRLNGPNSTLASYLISSSFSLVGTSEVFLRFDHYYKNHPLSEARVEISVNNDAWQTVALYEQNAGQEDSFLTANINLSAYKGFNDVRLRFSHLGNWGYWWAIDNVEIKRLYTDATVLWSENENLYVNSSATLPYNGENITTVYFKSGQVGEVSLNATLSIEENCFSETTTTTVNVFSIAPPLVESDEYYFDEGETIQDMADEVTGDNLVWYVLDENEEYVAIGNPENTPLIHEETYYVSQTLMDCESELVELTAFFDCPAPRGLQVEQLTNTSATLTWEEHTEAELEKIEDFYLTVIQVGNQEIVFEEYIYWNGDNSILVTDLMQNTEYLFIVKSICDEDKGIESDPITSDNFTTLYLDSPLLNNLSYYPNPTKNQITIENAFPIEKIEVFSLTGKRIIVHKEPSNKVTMNLGALSGGTYLAKIYAGGTMKIIKIVKQ